MDNGCVYGNDLVGRRGWKQKGASLLLDRPLWKSGGYVVVRNCKPDISEGDSYSVGGKGGGKKGIWHKF